MIKKSCCITDHLVDFQGNLLIGLHLELLEDTHYPLRELINAAFGTAEEETMPTLLQGFCEQIL